MSAYPNTRHNKAADRFTSKYGSPALLVHRTEGADDGYGGAVTIDTEYPVLMIETGSREAFAHVASADRGDRMGMINLDGADVTPRAGDVLVIDGDRIRLIELEPIRPNPDVAALVWRYRGAIG